MKISRLILMHLLIIFTSMRAGAVVLGDEQIYPDLEIQGESYPNACKPDQVEKRREIVDRSGIADKTRALQVIQSLLCSPSRDLDRKYVLKLIPAKIRIIADATGQRGDSKYWNRDQELIDYILAEGQAWNANLRVKNREIHLEYYENSSCIRGITVLLKGETWIVHELEEACD